MPVEQNHIPTDLEHKLEILEKTVAEGRTNTISPTPGLSLQNNEEMANLEKSLQQELENVRKLNDMLTANKTLELNNEGVRKTLRLAAFNLAQEVTSMSPKEIETQLQLNLANSTKAQPTDDLKKDLGLEMQKPDLNNQAILRPTPENNNVGMDFNAAAQAQRGPKNLPANGNVQAMCFYQQGNQLNAEMRLGNNNYIVKAKTLFEQLEKTIKNKLETLAKNIYGLNIGPASKNQSLNNVPKPGNDTKAKQEKEQQEKIELKKKQDKEEELKKKQSPLSKIPRLVPKPPY